MHGYSSLRKMWSRKWILNKRNGKSKEQIKYTNMKKYMISFLMLCLGYAGMMKAANTDISTLDNIIYVEPFNAAAGSQVQMSIKMKNSAAIRGFQFDLFLPDGVTAVKSAKGKILASLTESRLPLEDEHTLTLSEQGDGSIRFLCGSLADETFTGTDGEIATLTINIDGGVANGDYPVFLKNMKLTETDISKYYETESLETTLTVGGVSYTVLDETSTVAPVAATGVNVKVKRTINANEWSTICLPFAMSEEQVKAAFGNDVELKNFSSWSSETNTDDEIISINVGFTSVSAIEANHPYVIKVSTAISEFTVDGVDIDPADAEVVVGKGKTKGTFYGNYVAGTAVPEENLFISGNKFYYSTGSTTIKAFRGYFELKDVLDSYYDEAPSSVVFDFGDVTGIQKVSAQGQNDGIYYDLSGRRVEKPSKGVFIVNGKKVIIK